MKARYISWNPSASTLDMIAKAEEIINELRAQGYTLTLRQLYYQFVAKGLLPNKQQNYKRLGDILNKARLAGWIDWESIEDRVRTMRKRSHWDHPRGVMKSAAASWGMDLWRGQKYRPEVWIEKDALAGVAERVATKWDVPMLVCRGYTSQSAMYDAGERFNDWIKGREESEGEEDGETVTIPGREPAQPIIFYLGDHDPSGIQMAEDIDKRMEMFTSESGLVRRIALNMDQVRRHNPPPNPAKETDSRFAQYVAVHGSKCWELDALHPKVIAETIEKAIKSVLDEDMWKARKAIQEGHRGNLVTAAKRWDEVAAYLETHDAPTDDREEE